MSVAVKVWADDEPKPPADQSTNLSTVPSQNWLREEPAYAAELYGLERGAGHRGAVYRVNVLDNEDVTHHFTVTVAHQITATVRKLDEL
jgi:hypothetical protein